MATRRINSFIQHLMTEAPMTTGAATSSKATKKGGGTSYRSGDVDDNKGEDFEYEDDGGMSDDLRQDIRPEDFSAPFGLDDDDRFGPLALYYLKRPSGGSMTPPDYPGVPTKQPPTKPYRPGRRPGPINPSNPNGPIRLIPRPKGQEEN